MTLFCRKQSIAVIVSLAVMLCSLGGAAIAAEPTPSPGGTPQVAAPVKFSIRPNEGDNQAYFDDVEVAPGETIALEAALDNWGIAPVELDLYVVNGNVSPNGGFLAGAQDEQLRQHAEWIQLPAESIVLPPGSTEIFPFTVTVPEDADPGQYISGIVAATAEPMAMPGAENFEHIIRYSMAVSLLVPGELHYDFTLGEPTIDEEALNIPISHSGNYLIKPEGTVELTDSNGNVVLTAPLQLGSIYSGLSTYIYIALPVQLPEGDYILDASFEDPDSGATSSLSGVRLTLEEEVTSDYRIVQATIEPNGDDIVFANINFTIANSGGQVPATNAMLQVFHNGETVEEFPLATNQVLLNGENVYHSRYIPADEWEPGTYNFVVVLTAVDPVRGQEIELINETLDVELVIP